MTIKSLKSFLGLLITLLIPVVCFAQNGFRSETDMLKQATKYYESADYAAALQLYSQAVSNNPENSEFNYRLGVCIVEAGKEKGEAVRFLEIAKLSPQVSPDVDYFLGVALNYASRFDESVIALERFKLSGARKDKLKAADTYLRYGRNALEAQSDLSADRNDVTGKKEVSTRDVVQSFVFAEEAGKLMKVPAEFADKNCNGNLSCEWFFLSKGGNTLILSRQMGKGKGFDLFKMEKQRSGKWSEAIDLGTSINTPADEVYGTLSPDGKTLYFSSNGASSTGGLDIFRSTLNPGTGSWSAPSSMGFPVNSPGDDLYYMLSADNSKACFASDRESVEGKLTVYEAVVSRDNRRFFAIEGAFTCPQCMGQTSASISVIDPETMGAVAHVRSRPGTDTYKLKLYVPGDFIYQVEADGFAMAQQVVNLEERGRGTVFQEIILRRDESGKEKLVVVNRYDEGEDAVSPLAALPEGPENQKEAIAEPASVAVAEVSTAAPAESPAPVASESKPEAVAEPANVAVAEVPTAAPAETPAPVASEPKPEPVAAPKPEELLAADNSEVAKMEPEAAPTPAEVPQAMPESQASATITTTNAEVKQKSPEPAVAEQPTPVIEMPSNSNPETPAGISDLPVPTFKVQLGAFYSTNEKELKARLKGRIPDDCEILKNDKGYIQVISGNLPDYESAKLLKEQMIAAGFQGAFVVVFAGEQQASIADYVQPEPVTP